MGKAKAGNISRLSFLPFIPKIDRLDETSVNWVHFNPISLHD
jgi:hypothetical protein